MITSMQNEQVKVWRKLHIKKYRNKMKLFLVEGFHLLEEAERSGWHIDIIITEENVTPLFSWSEHAIAVVSDEVFASIAQTETPQGVIGVVRMKQIPKKNSGPILLLDAVQDPGNLGTIIRTADVMGVAYVIAGKGTVDLYNDKVIRATQGSLFHLAIEELDLQEAIPNLKKQGITVWASSLQKAVSLSEANFSGKDALIVGNEGAGISDSVLRLADQQVIIPITGEAESPNVSVATGILLYEMVK